MSAYMAASCVFRKHNLPRCYVNVHAFLYEYTVYKAEPKE